MIIAKVKVSGVECRKVFCHPIPHGAVGLQVEIEYESGIWDDLTKTVVFRSSETKDVVDAGELVTIPVETYTQQGIKLYMGVYGTNAAGTVVIPTLWLDLGKVRAGTDPSGDESTDPSLPVWAQILARQDHVEEVVITSEQIEAEVDAALEKARDSGDFDGPQGPQGKAGEDGYTPVKGMDYWTDADQKAMVNDVLAALPVWTGGSY